MKHKFFILKQCEKITHLKVMAFVLGNEKKYRIWLMNNGEK